MTLARIPLIMVLIIVIPAIAIPQSPPAPSQHKLSLIKNDKSPLFLEGQTTIADIEFEGLDTDDEVYGFSMDDRLYRSDFISSINGNKSAAVVGEKFSIEKASTVLKLLKRWLFGKGYLKADVVAYGTKLPKNRMKLTFAVERGLPLDVPELNFVGNENVTDQEFIDDFKQCSRESWKRYDLRRYQYFSEKCSRKLLFSKGFFKAKIYDLRAKIFNDHYSVTFGIYEGPRYRWGEIKIGGNSVLSREDILEMLDVTPGDIANGELLQDLIYEKLKRTYADLGYVQYNAEFDPQLIEPKAEGADGVVNISILIDEGKKFSVGRIAFVGVDAEIGKILKNDFPIKEGDIFNQTKIESGVGEINKSDKFCELNMDADVEIRTDEDAGLADLLITLRPCTK